MNVEFNQWWSEINIVRITNWFIRNFKTQISVDDIRQIAALSLLKTLKSFKDKEGRTIPNLFWCILRNGLINEVKNKKRVIRVDNRKSYRYNGIEIDVFSIDLNFLSEKEITLLRNRFELGKTLKEISLEHNCSQEWVRQKLSKILDKIKNIYTEFNPFNRCNDYREVKSPKFKGTNGR